MPIVNYDLLDLDQAEALDMIMNKIGRIVNGNSNNVDSWQDIAGYAQLIVERLKKEQELGQR